MRCAASTGIGNRPPSLGPAVDARAGAVLRLIAYRQVSPGLDAGAPDTSRYRRTGHRLPSVTLACNVRKSRDTSGIARILTSAGRDAPTGAHAATRAYATGNPAPSTPRRRWAPAAASVAGESSLPMKGIRFTNAIRRCGGQRRHLQPFSPVARTARNGFPGATAPRSLGHQPCASAAARLVASLVTNTSCSGLLVAVASCHSSPSPSRRRSPPPLARYVRWDHRTAGAYRTLHQIPRRCNPRPSASFSIVRGGCEAATATSS